MLYEILPDPRPLIAAPATGDGQVLQFHRVIPEQVPVGHFEPNGREVVDLKVDRSEYLAWVDQACAAQGGALEIRFFDHFEQVFDAAVLDSLPSIVTLSIDSLSNLVNPEAIGRLPRLKALRFGPNRIADKRILSVLGLERLDEFTLAGTPTPAIDLAPLAGAARLRSLRLLGQGRNAEAIGDLADLAELAIQPSAKMAIAFIGRLQRLEVLKLVLGNCTSLEPIGALPHLHDLSTREVRNLERLGDFQRFPALRRVQLSDQPRIERLELGPANQALEHLYLYSLPRLAEVQGLSELPRLASLFAYDTLLAPDWDALPASVTHFRLLSRLTKGREAHEAAVRAHGLNPELHPDATWFYK